MVSKKLDLSGLNNSQLQAVLTLNGPIQVPSCAGSGKTRVLTHRIAHMIKDVGIKPENIMVTTFTKKAATEMEERLSKLISKKAVNELMLGTFHSIGYRILKKEYGLMNHKLKDFQLIESNPIKWMIKEILRDLHIKTDEKYNENIFVADINKLKMELIAPEGLIANFLLGTGTEHDRNLMAVYEEYEKRKDAKCLIDFNDMLFKLYYLFMENPEILKKYQNQIQYVLVDEAQDNNNAQYELIQMIASPQNNVFIVGDDDQSIYKFRGARPDQFIAFKEAYEGTQVINLEENYRSLPYILETANKVIKHNTVRIEKELKPFKRSLSNETEKAIVEFADDEDQEAEIIAEDIVKLQEQGKFYSDMAIIYRTNAQSRALEDELIKHAIPYIVYGGISFYERSEIKDILAYLKLAVDLNDNEAFERIINKPSRYIGKVFMDNLRRIAQVHNCSLYYALQYMNMNYNVTVNVANFKDQIRQIQKIISLMSDYPEETVGDIVDQVVRIVKYDEYLKKENGDEEDNDKLENLDSLGRAGLGFHDVKTFLKYVDSVVNARYDDSISTVKLMTIHKSKGLEFPVIFITGLSDGILPHKYSLQDNDLMALEEERRLMYVAITRAQDYLKITSPSSYQGKLYQPSRFIMEGEFTEIANELESEL